jgi:2-succinyl-5-enolpyruvyl-6-hydroxy-3-cyclohexene-1-carboxylate synthase
MQPSKWLSQLSTEYVSSDYQYHWLTHFNTYLEKRPAYFEQIPWSDMKAFQAIFHVLPDNINLQLGNSSTIRYAQLFQMNASHRVFSNRGTSGIDGCTSTAIGAAVGSGQQTVLVTGDIGFLYDSNGLWNNYIPNNFKIIVVNNSGGGIFRILPGEKDEDYFATYFETTHDLNASDLCRMHRLGYHHADDEFAFAKAYKNFINTDDSPQLLEIFTPREVNDQVLLNYFKYLK